ncbi:HTH-type transcriptional regulator GltC [Ruegeria sp. THAF57]|uniref:LysR family transcriptional regulator n=1 Tax=Ruegeria sp. THAF57 TaxID=2744555 RepID=UPI0015DE1B59|nr:LysR family transcriptional regulator [Ruegeria sp. THAF57]CAD0186788.1 HTH-type transcriptional regulator GltC [Ruegeria sp. THAF57]
MRIDLRQLEMFEAIERYGSLTLAAEALNVTQPAISLQMQKLEAQVDLALLERAGRGVKITEAGEEVLHQARRINRVLDDLRENLRHFKGVQKGVLRIAVVSTANYFIPDYLARFRKNHPGVEIDFRVANRDNILEMLASNESDLAITGQPPDDSDLIARRFKDNPLVVIAPPDHPLAGRTDLEPSELAQYPFVVREPGSGTRAAMERAFREHGLECQTSCVLSSNEAVKHAVQAQLGLAVISGQTTELETETQRLTLLDCRKLSLKRTWYVVYRSFRRLPPAAQEFRTQLLSD